MAFLKNNIYLSGKTSVFFISIMLLFVMLNYSFSFANSEKKHTQHITESGHAEGVKIELETNPVPIEASISTLLSFSLLDKNGKPLKGITISHERILHVVIISEDFRIFSHVHPEDFGEITQKMINEAKFNIKYTFPKAGRYLVAIDAAAGEKHISRLMYVDVKGSPAMEPPLECYAFEKNFKGYWVKLSVSPKTVNAGVETELRYNITRDGNPVTDLETYLAAAMHLAIVNKNLSDFKHTHGLIPGTPGEHPMGHIHGIFNERFGPDIVAKVTFPEKGTYNIFGEFKHNGKVILTEFTLTVK